MIFLDACTGRVLHRMYVRSETNALYLSGLEHIRSCGTEILAVVCDGHTGLLSSISECPAQMCQFHMFQIIRRKLTNNPRLQCGRELLSLCRRMFRMSKEEFKDEFNIWCTRWEKFLSERTVLVNGTTTYTHRKLRSARRSVKTHLPWLFTWEKHTEAGIPKTTNKLEGVNSQLKKMMRAHNGMNEKNRKKVIDALLNSFGNNSP